MGANSRALAWVAGLVLLAAVFVATTSDGPEWTDVSGEAGVDSAYRSSTEDDSSSAGGSGGDSRADPAPDTEGSGPSGATRTIAVVILMVATVALLVGVVVGLRFLLRRPSLDGTMLPRAVTATEDDPDPEPPDDLFDEVEGGLRSIAEGSPRNAIVATWIRLEEAAVAAGFEQREAETPAEFVRRAISTYPVDERAIVRLADLYREARFSRHELTEEHRGEARECLRLLNRQLSRSGAR